MTDAVLQALTAIALGFTFITVFTAWLFAKGASS